MNWLPLLAIPPLADPTAADQQVGVWGGVVVMGLVVGTLLLWLNMRKQLRKIDVPADHEEESAAEEPETGSAAGPETAEPEGTPEVEEKTDPA